MFNLIYQQKESCGRQKIEQIDMIALPFSVRIAPPSESTAFQCRNRRKIKSSSVELNGIGIPKSNQSLPSLRRREAAAIVISAGILQFARFAVAACEFASAKSGLEYCDKVVGTGPPAVQGQLIKAHYVGRLENGKVFDSSYDRGKPLTFRIGVGEVIKGWDEGILGGNGIPGMLAGGKRQLRIPPALGYGQRGAGCRGGSCIIPPDSVLLFDVEFVGKV